MKITVKVLVVFTSVIIVLYFGAFYALPSVTVINKSNLTVNNIRVDLPNSGLDFGGLDVEAENTIHYSLEQSDGSYQYQIEFSTGLNISGSCGYVTNNEINKRIVLSILEDKVVCE